MREVSASRGRWTPGRSVRTSCHSLGARGDAADRAARRLRLVGDDRDLVADDRVDERRLADVRPPGERDEAGARASSQPPHDLGLHGEHLAVVGLVVHAGQVQHAVHDRLDEVGRVLGADDDVAELARAQRVAVVLVDREGEDVGRPGLAALGQVELGDPLRVDELDRDVAVLDARGRRGEATASCTRPRAARRRSPRRRARRAAIGPRRSRGPRRRRCGTQPSPTAACGRRAALGVLGVGLARSAGRACGGRRRRRRSARTRRPRRP